MRFKRVLFSVIIVFSVISPPFSSISGFVQVENQPHIVEMAQSLPNQGVLTQKDDGYVYIDLPNEYLTELASYIDSDETVFPVPSYLKEGGIGAHISVIYVEEILYGEIPKIEELGELFSFEIVELQSIAIDSEKGIKKLWILTVSSPELEALRQKYGLQPLLQGYEFHITIGEEWLVAQEAA